MTRYMPKRYPIPEYRKRGSRKLEYLSIWSEPIAMDGHKKVYKNWSIRCMKLKWHTGNDWNNTWCFRRLCLSFNTWFRIPGHRIPHPRRRTTLALTDTFGWSYRKKYFLKNYIRWPNLYWAKFNTLWRGFYSKVFP